MSEHNLNETEKALVYTARSVVVASLLFMVCSAILISTFIWREETEPKRQEETHTVISSATKSSAQENWAAPEENTIPAGKEGEAIRYGKELIVNTARYFGPNGSVATISNGMNCQNCHLQGGTKTFGNNYSVFFASYPKKSNRSGTVVPASSRIAECFERSLAGKAPDPSGKEVQAMLAYLKWLGSGLKKGNPVFGTGCGKLKYLDRPADPAKGKILYASKCVSCHGKNGDGLRAADQKSYTYPPLWGKHSYNDAAGMYRLANFSGFVKNNMPYGATYEDPQLSDEEAWDLAAFVNSQPRPHKDQQKDYPDLSKKPIDAPFGPYGDQFIAQQHKYGPFKPIADYYKSKKKK
ncbi:c-type cytochrome [Pedobacter cryoconitis]|uniref:Thiosulfate dehydrogenase n=1 Tax=Pedobacter cryoconitis TaxID=188932 RepID=A0A7X0J781_9SPHI|nr:c-type cytochrome [Pedobacter cryoconitis]MBB6501924.1 thiosulfate dehydrogenase [Pedobacter cryoconitis]